MDINNITLESVSKSLFTRESEEEVEVDMMIDEEMDDYTEMEFASQESQYMTQASSLATMFEVFENSSISLEAEDQSFLSKVWEKTKAIIKEIIGRIIESVKLFINKIRVVFIKQQLPGLQKTLNEKIGLWNADKTKLDGVKISGIVLKNTTSPEQVMELGMNEISGAYGNVIDRVLKIMKSVTMNSNELFSVIESDAKYFTFVFPKGYGSDVNPELISGISAGMETQIDGINDKDIRVYNEGGAKLLNSLKEVGYATIAKQALYHTKDINKTEVDANEYVQSWIDAGIDNLTKSFAKDYMKYADNVTKQTRRFNEAVKNSKYKPSEGTSDTATKFLNAYLRRSAMFATELSQYTTQFMLTSFLEFTYNLKNVAKLLDTHYKVEKK